jgi:DNA (cytosine-5)-methyltransferase 1
MVAELKNGPWNLTDLNDVPKNGFTVFSCFHCGGGSTMGYKLAGYDVRGGVEIDPEMMAVYKANHHPRHSYLMGVQDFKKLPDESLPKELFELDILDGSPPCSTFSMAGKREEKWGEEHHFREGQAKQVLDDLFFQFIDVAEKLQPKVVVAENVKGLILGKAKGYVKEIFSAFRKAGYEPQLFLLNAAAMGVPQRRERIFFIAKRKDLALPKIDLNFSEKLVSVKQSFSNMPQQDANKLSPETERLWNLLKPGEPMSFAEGRGKGFNNYRISWESPAGTLATKGSLYHPMEPRMLSDLECLRLQSFPDDYDYGKTGARYLCGMSVPPFMTQRIAREIELQWLSRLEDNNVRRN